MKSMRLIHDHHLHNLRKNGNVVIALALAQFESTFPLLIGYLHYLRQVNGTHHKSDIQNQNAQMLKEFVYLCEHNLLFFLTVTGQFAIIHDLFENKAELAKVIALMEEIEKEHNNAAINKANFLITFKSLQAVRQPQHKAVTPDMYGVDAMLLYKYYEEELMRLTITYHIKQSQLYYHAANATLDDLEQAIASVQKNPDIELTVKFRCLKDLENLKIRVARTRENYNRVYGIFHKSEQQNDQQAALLHLAGKNYFNEVATVSEVLKMYRNLSADLEIFYERSGQRIVHTTTQAGRNEQQFLKQQEENIVHLYSAREIVQKRATKNLKDIIDDLNQLPKHMLNEEQKNRVLEALKHLQLHYDMLKISNGNDVTIKVLNECANELKNIKQIPLQNMPAEMMHQFEIDTVEFSKMGVNLLPIHKFDAALMTNLSTETMEPSVVGEEKHLISDPISLKDSDISENASPEQEEHHSPILINEDKAPHQSPQESPKQDDLKNEAQNLFSQRQDTGMQTAFFKRAYDEVKASNSVKMVPQVNQSDYQASIETMIGCIVGLKILLSYDEEMLVKIEQFEILLNNSAGLGFDKVKEEELKDMHTVAQELAKHNNVLSDCMEKLVEIFDFLELPAQTKPQL